MNSEFTLFFFIIEAFYGWFFDAFIDSKLKDLRSIFVHIQELRGLIVLDFAKCNLPWCRIYLCISWPPIFEAKN